MKFLLLGPLEVRSEGRVLDLAGQKLRAVLVRLLLDSGRVVSREQLIDALWEDDPPATARKALQGYVSQLRKVIGRERLLTQPPGYVLRLDRDEFDLREFERLHREGELEAVLSLWRGPPLAELSEFEFARAEAARLNELRLACLESRVERDLDSGKAEDVVGELEVLVREHPLRERLRAQQMLALYRAGRQAEALEAYQQARELLVEELGIEPTAALQRLQKGILSQDPALEPPTGTAAQDARSTRTRLVLAEDHYLLREGVRRLLEAQPDLEVAAVCEDFDSLLAAVEAERPDVVVTDIRMPPGNLDEGIRASDWIRVEHPEIGVVVLSQYVEPAYARAVFEPGPGRRAYLLKERVHDLGELAAAIRAVAEGGSVIDPKVVEALVAEKTRRAQSPLDELTPRERDVLREMAEGKNNATVAATLHLSERTVEKVIHSIFLKLGLAWDASVHKRVKAVIFYLSGIDAETRPVDSSS